MSANAVIVQHAIDIIIREFGGKMRRTVDVVKAGDPRQPLRGVATTFLATAEVIERAAQTGANLLVTHEPTFYVHRDNGRWLKNDPVFQAKRDLVDRYGMVIFRAHDYIHRDLERDPVIRGLAGQLGWKDLADRRKPYLCTIPDMQLEILANTVKERLSLHAVRVVGDPEQTCRRIALMAGAVGGEAHIKALWEDRADVVVCGEVHEWDSPEYVRDATKLGRPKGMIVIGHEVSEEAGMAWLAEWLGGRLPGVPVQHIPSGNPFRLV